MNETAPRCMPGARRALAATLVVAAVVLFLAFVWFAAELLLLLFASVLFSILLRGLSGQLRKYTGIGSGLSLTLVFLGLLSLLAGLVWLVADQVIAQVSEIQQTLPEGLEDLRKRIEQYSWGREALENLPSPREWLSDRGGSVLARFTGIASTTLGAVVNTVLIVVIGLYLASQPGLYSRGLRSLIPIPHRRRAAEILHLIDEALWRWLIGRFCLMLVNALVTFLGLLLLGIPFSLTLGLLAGLLNFIPNIGPWIAAIPAVLVGLMQSPLQGLYVALLYLVFQGIDAYVLTPLVDRQSVKLPPVLTISAQVLLGAAFGFLGILLASPLTTMTMILVQTLYVEDTLGDKPPSSDL